MSRDKQTKMQLQFDLFLLLLNGRSRGIKLDLRSQEHDDGSWGHLKPKNTAFRANEEDHIRWETSKNLFIIKSIITLAHSFWSDVRNQQKWKLMLEYILTFDTEKGSSAQSKTWLKRNSLLKACWFYLYRLKGWMKTVIYESERGRKGRNTGGNMQPVFLMYTHESLCWLYEAAFQQQFAALSGLPQWQTPWQPS